MTHTPTPWHILREADGAIAIGNRSLPHVAVVRYSHNPALSEETGKANTYHIIKCVNLHDELVEGAYNAQQRILGVLRNHEAGESLNPAILRGALDALNAALAKASGEA